MPKCEYICDACGLDLTLTDEQQIQAILTGKITRPLCPETASGQHVMSDEQLKDLHVEG